MRLWLIFAALLAAVPSQARDILKTRCVSCHSGTKPAAGLDLSRTEALRQSAARITRVVESGKMPPSGKLPAAEIAKLKKSLPTAPPLWSLKPLSSPLPSARRGEMGGGFLDSLVRAQLAKSGLKPSPEAVEIHA